MSDYWNAYNAGHIVGHNAGYAEGVAKVKAAVKIELADTVAFAKNEWITDDGFVIAAVESVRDDVLAALGTEPTS